MQWLETLIVTLAAVDGLAAGANCQYFGRYAWRTKAPSRRVGAAALALVNGAMALEAALFLSIGPAWTPPQSAIETAALLAVRWVLLLASLSVSLLALRGRQLLREERRHDGDADSRHRAA